MSYNVYLKAAECPTCHRRGEEPDCPDPTYNLTPIFDLALTGEDLPNAEVSEAAVVLFRTKTDRPRGLRLLSGRKAKDTIEWLEKGMKNLRNPALHDRFVALEPPNKWGTLPDAIYVFDKLLQAAKDYPENEWEVH